MKMFLIPGDYLKLVLQGSYMSNADKIKLSGPNKEKFLQDIKVRNWMINVIYWVPVGYQNQIHTQIFNKLFSHPCFCQSGNALSTSTAN